ncbi:MAG: four helix bundle protein [Flavobacteriaceae bacterium]
MLSHSVEGSSKSTNTYFNNYLEPSLGSSFDWETQLIITFNEGYIPEEKFTELKIKELQKMISRFKSSLSV